MEVRRKDAGRTKTESGESKYLARLTRIHQHFTGEHSPPVHFFLLEMYKDVGNMKSIDSYMGVKSVNFNTILLC